VRFTKKKPPPKKNPKRIEGELAEGKLHIAAGPLLFGGRGYTLEIPPYLGSNISRKSTQLYASKERKRRDDHSYRGKNRLESFAEERRMFSAQNGGEGGILVRASPAR